MIWKIILLFINISINVLNVKSWHGTVDYNFTTIINDQDELKLFESAYGDKDYFTLLSSERNNHFDLNTNVDSSLNKKSSILIGARNNLYELNVPDLKLIETQTWQSSSMDVMKCLNRSIIVDKEECDNYIKMFLKINDDTFRLCATNALNPKCRFYQKKKNSKTVMINETSGIGYSPLRAYENKYIYNYVNRDKTNKYLYTANSIDLNRYFSSINRVFDQDKISTNVDDNNWLYKPEFVSSFTNDERIFFVFNEETIIENDDISALRTRRHSKISQICLNDNGVPLNSLRNIWTTYLKSKLSCVYDTSKLITANTNRNNNFVDSFKFDSSLFYFDEIRSMSDLYKSPASNNQAYFYAVFSTSTNSITGSAICSFSMDQIMGSYNGDYKMKSTNSDTQIPNPRPSQCPNKLTYQHIIFSRKNFQMNLDIVSEALVIETKRSNRFLSIDVDFNVKSQLNTNLTSDVLFVGTDDGRVLTLVLQHDNNNSKKLVYSEELTIINNNHSITNIKFHSKTNFILLTKNKVISTKSHYCHLKMDINRCNNLINPYCIWSNVNSQCMHILDYNNYNNSISLNNETFINNYRHVNNNILKNENKQTINNNDYNNIKNLKSNETIYTTKSSNYILTNPLNTSSTTTTTTFTYKILNNDITISVNLVLFILLAITFSLLLILFAFLLSFNFYKKFFKKKNSESSPSSSSSQIDSNKFLNFKQKLYLSSDKNEIKDCKFKSIFLNIISKSKLKTKNNGINDEALKKLSINSKLDSPRVIINDRPSPSSFMITSSMASSSSKSYSPAGFEEETNTKSSSLSNYKTSINFEDDPRYVYVNNSILNSFNTNISKQSHSKLNSTLPVSQQLSEMPKFLDYDDTEYYSTLKKGGEHAFDQPLEQSNLDDKSVPILDSLPGSSRTLSSLAILMRNHFDLPEKMSNNDSPNQLFQQQPHPIYSTVTKNSKSHTNSPMKNNENLNSTNVNSMKKYYL